MQRAREGRKVVRHWPVTLSPAQQYLLMVPLAAALMLGIDYLIDFGLGGPTMPSRMTALTALLAMAGAPILITIGIQQSPNRRRRRNAPPGQ